MRAILHYRRSWALLSFALLLTALPLAAVAAEPLRWQGGFASFEVAAGGGLSLEKLPTNAAALETYAPAMPPEAHELEVIGLRGPGFSLKIGTAKRMLRGSTEAVSVLAAQLDNGPAFLLPANAASNGLLTRLGAWGVDGGGDGVVLVTTFSSGGDVPLAALYIGGNGVSQVDLGGARSLSGRFDLADVNGDGTYELITRRNLDGRVGGIEYKSVRVYDAESLTYRPDPDTARDFFAGEVAYYDWVLSTREAILASPERYMSSEPRDYVFAASRGGELVGFDSLIPLDELPDAGGDVAKYNREVENALRHVQTYRDELAAWLAGTGGYPSVWRMGR